MANIINRQPVYFSNIFEMCVVCLVAPLGDGGGGVGAGDQGAGVLAVTPGAAGVSVAGHHLQYSTVQYSTVPAPRGPGARCNARCTACPPAAGHVHIRAVNVPSRCFTVPRECHDGRVMIFAWHNS